MKRRWVKVLAIAVVVLAVLFTAVDRTAVHYANDEAAQLAREKYGYGNTTDGYLDVAIEGFPFLTQAASRAFGHVTLTAGEFYIDTTTNRQGGYLHIDRLHLDLRDVKVTSLTARSAEANLATGTLTLSMTGNTVKGSSSPPGRPGRTRPPSHCGTRTVGHALSLRQLEAAGQRAGVPRAWRAHAGRGRLSAQ